MSDDDILVHRLYQRTGKRSNHWGEWYWPSFDHVAFDAITLEVRNASRVRALVHMLGDYQEVRVIQAGGNAGMMPILLSDMSCRVLSFEPLWANFISMAMNVEARGANVVPLNLALLPVSSMCVGMKVDRNEMSNGGAFYAFEMMGGSVLGMPITHYEWFKPHLIWLDTEGSEPAIIAGAESMLRGPDAPIVITELKGLGRRYGWSDDAFTDHMIDMGYCAAHKFGRDVVWSPVAKAERVRELAERLEIS